jgi:hypothetical protein
MRSRNLPGTVLPIVELAILFPARERIENSFNQGGGKKTGWRLAKRKKKKSITVLRKSFQNFSFLPGISHVAILYNRYLPVQP